MSSPRAELLLLSAFVALPCLGLTPPGIVFESEDISEPKNAWRQDQRGPDFWCLWTQEEDIANKRSGLAVLASPAVTADRATPEEGAPSLHSVVTGLPPGWYAIYVSPPGRPLAYSLDGKTWFKHSGGELSLGIRELPEGRFELWVDDRYAAPPNNPGSGYYDYIRFVPLSAAAANVERQPKWLGIERWVVDHGGWVVEAADTELEGFVVDYGTRIRGANVGDRFLYRFPRPGTWHVAVELTDSRNGVEKLSIALEDKEIGEVILDSAGDGLALLRKPVQVKAGDRLVFTCREAVNDYRVRRLFFSPEPIVEPPPRIENLMAFSPTPGEVELCWTTSRIAPTGAVEYGVGDAFTQRTEPTAYEGRNHRVWLTGLDAETEYRGRVVTTFGGEEIRSAPITFRASPPTPPATESFRIDLTLPEPTERARTDWPATVGMPFPRGRLGRVEDLRLIDDNGAERPLQAELFSRWPDGSVRWAILSFLAASDSRFHLEANRAASPPSVRPVTAVVNESAEEWRVATDRLSFVVAKSIPALFDRVGIDRNADGRVDDTERVGRAPLGANLKLETSDGAFYTCGPPESFTVEANGPIRAVLRWSGQLMSPQGDRVWMYVIRVTLWRSQSWFEVSVAVGNDQPQPTFRDVNMLALRVPLDGAPQLRGAIDGLPSIAVTGDDQLWVHQDKDNHYTLHTPDGDQEGERATGVATAADDRTQVVVAMPDFWQTYPKGFAVKTDGIHVRLLPPLAPDTYGDEQSLKDYYRLYTWFRDGKYHFRAGQLTRQRVAAWYGAASDRIDPVAFGQWIQSPLVPQAPPAYLCATGVLGRPIFPRTAGVWDDYETFFETGFQNTERDRESRRCWGWMHYGDWFGERMLNYGNSEYDLAWAMGLQWLRTGDRRYFDRGRQMADHVSTVDTIWGAAFKDRNGLVYEHSFNHVGTDLPEDSPLLAGGDMAGYVKAFGKGMLGGAIDRQGHVFQEGNWLYAALTGDRWYRDAAERVCDNQAALLTPRYDFTIERSGGWPLINAVNAYAFSGNPYYLNAARLMIERTLERQETTTGGWPHFHDGSETDGEQCLGGKAFAVGILTHGILRYLEQEPEPRPDVERMLVRAADWLKDESWAPDKGFRYITNNRYYSDKGGRGATCLLNAEVVAFAWEQTKDPKYLQFWQEMMKGLFDGQGSGMGKSFTMEMRQTVFGLDRIRAAGITTARGPARAMLRSRAVLADGRATVRVIVDNPRAEPAEATVTVVRGATMDPVSWPVEPRSVAPSPPLALHADAPGEVVLRISLTGTSPSEQVVRLAPEPPLPAPRTGHGIAYAGPAESATRRALRSIGIELPWVSDPAHTDLTEYAGLIIACDSWGSPTVDLPAGADALADFVRGGGRLAVWQLNDAHWRLDYLPLDLLVFEPESRLGELAAAEHPLFASPERVGKLLGAMMYDTLGPVEPPWVVLATDADGRPAIIEAPDGHGRLLVIQPSLDRYAAGDGDAPDANLSVDAARALLRNLLVWLEAR